MKEVKRYPTKPFECWQKAKELRLEWYKRLGEANEKGYLVVAGGTEAGSVFPSGLGEDYIPLTGETYSASVAAAGVAEEYASYIEKMGYARDLCSYCRNSLGALVGKKWCFPGGSYPDKATAFLLQFHSCDTHGKWYQIVHDLTGKPYIMIDFVDHRWPQWHESEKRKKAKSDYIVAQMLDAIEQMEKVTGRKFDDERFADCLYNEMVATSTWAKCCELNKNIPAPMDEKTMYSFYVILALRRFTKEAVDFMNMLYDELKERVAQGIAAVPTERFRVIHDSQPPWYALRIFRYMEKYGVVVLGCFYSFDLSGGWFYGYENGELVLKPAEPIPRDQLKTREDIVRALVYWYGETNFQTYKALRFPIIGRRDCVVKIAKDWKCDGAIIHLNRGCEGTAAGQLEVRRALVEAGFPVLTYEGNNADPREFDEPRTIARIDAYMEARGLKKLED